MNYCIESISKYIPPYNSGYRFIKKVIVYIPYQEVGLSVLERKVTNLSLTYETVLKLLEQGVNDIDEMTIMLGLDIDIYKEIIAQLAIEDLVNVSGMSISLSVKGTQALKDLMKIAIVKNQINRIYTNLITGEIEKGELNNLHERLTPNCICLDQCMKVDIQFFRDHFIEIDSIYNKDKIDESGFINQSVEHETLYRILDLVYSEARYYPTDCFVYINDDDSSLLFSFENDKSSIYATTLISQISNNIGGAMNLFKRGGSSNQQINSNNPQEKVQALTELVGLIEQRTKTIVPTDEIEAHYYKDRYLLDGEINDILMNCNDYKPNDIIICSINMKNYLQDNNLLDTLLSSNPSANISFIYDEKEHGIDKSKKWLLEHATENDKKRIKFKIFQNEKDINYTIIICQPGFVINTFYEEIMDNIQHCLIKEISDISFNTEIIQDAIEKVQLMTE